MFRYLAFVWDANNNSQAIVARRLSEHVRTRMPTWACVSQELGLSVFVSDTDSRSSRAYQLQRKAGAVIGTLFPRTSDDQSASTCDDRISEAESCRIISTNGRHLVHAYWGRYVAFLFSSDKDGMRKTVLRDPTGELPCFTTTFEGVNIFFSNVLDCMAINAFSFTVNWSFIDSHVSFGGTTYATALSEVTEVYGGEFLTFVGENVSRGFHWNPFKVADSDSIEDVDVAVSKLLSTTKQVTHSWATCHDGILHRLSGGLDSSIVLGCLRNAPRPPGITCATYFMPHGNSDERPYARLAAKRARCEHVEIERDLSKIDLRELLCLAPTPKPIMGGFAFLELSRLEGSLARAKGATAIFTGDGGDAIFGSLSKKDIVSDYAHRHGMRLKLFQLAATVAPLTNRSVWRILAQAFKDRTQARPLTIPKELLREGRRLLSPEALIAATDRRFPHPWFDIAEKVAPGVAIPVMSLAVTRQFYDPLVGPDDSAPEMVYPLCSQPLVELCLQIPSYMHAHDGRDRGLARQAFAQVLPQEIADRQWKDRASGSVEAVFMANITFLRELLLDGQLAGRGLLNRRQLEEALSGKPGRSGAFVGEIIDYATTEAWLRGWAERNWRAAA